ncbi:hypothetical protein ABZ816_11505 [Actinosynnema sp. NPDC047251]|nr:hypothetical protein [Saccharothrix espanaensis]
MKVLTRLDIALGNELGKIMNALSSKCRPLTWSVDELDWLAGRLRVSAFPGSDYSDDEGLTVVNEWVDAFGLVVTQGSTCPGVIEYVGVIGDIPVKLWGVVDRDVFERLEVTHGQER